MARTRLNTRPIPSPEVKQVWRDLGQRPGANGQWGYAGLHSAHPREQAWVAQQGYSARTYDSFTDSERSYIAQGFRRNAEGRWVFAGAQHASPTFVNAVGRGL